MANEYKDHQPAKHRLSFLCAHHLRRTSPRCLADCDKATAALMKKNEDMTKSFHDGPSSMQIIHPPGVTHRITFHDIINRHGWRRLPRLIPLVGTAMISQSVEQSKWAGRSISYLPRSNVQDGGWLVQTIPAGSFKRLGVLGEWDNPYLLTSTITTHRC